MIDIENDGNQDKVSKVVITMYCIDLPNYISEYEKENWSLTVFNRLDRTQIDPEV